MSNQDFDPTKSRDHLDRVRESYNRRDGGNRPPLTRSTIPEDHSNRMGPLQRLGYFLMGAVLATGGTMGINTVINAQVVFDKFRFPDGPLQGLENDLLGHPASLCLYVPSLTVGLLSLGLAFRAK